MKDRNDALSCTWLSCLGCCREARVGNCSIRALERIRNTANVKELCAEHTGGLSAVLTRLVYKITCGFNLLRRFLLDMLHPPRLRPNDSHVFISRHQLQPVKRLYLWFFVLLERNQFLFNLHSLLLVQLTQCFDSGKSEPCRITKDMVDELDHFSGNQHMRIQLLAQQSEL